MATAMALASRGMKDILVLEAEPKLAQHQTGRNSGVIHSGLYYKPGSLKASMCAQGRDAMYAFCRQHSIPHDPCGKIVVATTNSELPQLQTLEQRGIANGLTGITRLNPDEIRQREPFIRAIAGLFVPQTGIVDYTHVTAVMAKTVTNAGGEIRTSSPVLHARVEGDHAVIETSTDRFTARHMINCAGLQSDRVARLSGFDPQVRIVPFRGEYFVLSQTARTFIRNLVYPVPDPRFPFLGVHFTRMIDGGVEAGPNAVLSLKRHGYHRTAFSLRDTAETLRYSGFHKLARQHWRMGFMEFTRSMSKRLFLRELRRFIPELQLHDLHTPRAGVRAQAVAPDGRLIDDFHILRNACMIHVLNAPSPAATASIAIGRHIADLVNS